MNFKMNRSITEQEISNDSKTGIETKMVWQTPSITALPITKSTKQGPLAPPDAPEMS
jgi:hypothetical protein